jgi:putative tricarboxylic transport membrane protein
MIWTIEQTRGEVTTTNPKMTAKGLVSDAKEAVRRGWKGTWIGSILGFFVGVLPAAGATPGSLMSYGVAKMISKTPEEYGHGSPDGVAAPEAANNSASTGSMLPMLTLGIPGSPTTAILLGGMVMWGLTPGPRLFIDESEFVWGLIGSFYISNFAAVLINLAFIPLFVWMLRMPFTILAPLIFVLSIVGGFAASRSMHDLWLIVAFGLGAFFLRKFDYPLAPAVLAIVLGPIAEPTLRQSLLLSSGDPSIFFTRPIAGPITVIAIFLILLPAFKLLRGKQKVA